jgi:hypothetical protein
VLSVPRPIRLLGNTLIVASKFESVSEIIMLELCRLMEEAGIYQCKLLEINKIILSDLRLCLEAL